MFIYVVHWTRFGRWLFAIGQGDEAAIFSGIPLQRLARTSPGTAISAMQVATALRRGILVPYKKREPEEFKSGLDLVVTDGSLAGPFHERVHQRLPGIEEVRWPVDDVVVSPAMPAF